MNLSVQTGEVWELDGVGDTCVDIGAPVRQQDVHNPGLICGGSARIGGTRTSDREQRANRIARFLNAIKFQKIDEVASVVRARRASGFVYGNVIGSLPISDQRCGPVNVSPVVSLQRFCSGLRDDWGRFRGGRRFGRRGWLRLACGGRSGFLREWLWTIRLGVSSTTSGRRDGKGGDGKYKALHISRLLDTVRVSSSRHGYIIEPDGVCKPWRRNSFVKVAL